MSDAAHGHDGHEDLPRGLAKALRLAEEQEERMRNPTERDKLRFRVMAAGTPEETAEARKAMRDRVEARPEDRCLFGRLGGDMRMRAAIREQGRERRSAWGPREWEREALVEQGKRAETPEEIAEAKVAIREWIEKYPQDAAEFGLAETMMEEMELGIDPPEGSDRAVAEEYLGKAEPPPEDVLLPAGYHRRLRQSRGAEG